jgi:hypothetical protein
MSTMSNADFEALYRADSDPWGYRSSEYERRKYEATLTAAASGTTGVGASAGWGTSSAGVQRGVMVRMGMPGMPGMPEGYPSRATPTPRRCVASSP